MECTGMLTNHSMVPMSHTTIACRHSCHKTILQNKRALSINTTHIKSLHNGHRKQYNRMAVFAARPEEDGIEASDDDEDFLFEEDEDLIGEDFEDVTISTNEQPEYIKWADYMEKDLQPAPFSEFADEHDTTTSSTDTQPTTPSPEINLKIAREKEIWKSKDPVIANSSAARFFGGDTLPIGKPQASAELSEWDLRASMEKKKRMDKDRTEWLAYKQKTLGRYSAIASDWRNDTRITNTGDPTQPYYREWTMKEIWDLITLNGRSIDPRSVPHRVEKPGSRVDFVAEGFVQQPDIPDWLALQGKLLREEDEEAVVDRDAEVALFASEFSDFEDFGGLSGGDQGGEGMDDGFGGDL